MVFTALYSDDSTDVIEFFLDSAVPPSYILGTEDLFKLDSKSI